MIRFEVCGEPQGKARPRVIRNRNGTVRAYTPQKTKDYEWEIAKAYIAAAGDRICVGAVEISIDATMRIPKSTSKKMREKMLRDQVMPQKKPDVDNIAKAVCDALNGIAYRDDSQVTLLVAKKRYGDEPKIKVSIREV